MSEEAWANEAAARIAEKAMPAFMGAWQRIADGYGLTGDELWTVKVLQVRLEEADGKDYDFATVAEAYKRARDAGLSEAGK